MVTTEIPGSPIGRSLRGADVSRVLAAAGRDLAVIHGVEVAGFGWIRRDQPGAARLEAELPTLRAFALGDLDAHLAALTAFLDADRLWAVRRVVTRCDSWLEAERAILAHGDLDATHVFHLDGEYTGLIDFGEIRGTDCLYDLGHVALHDGETVPYPLLSHLLAGYSEVAVLPPDHERQIRLWSLLIGVRALARSANRPRAAYQNHLARAIRRALEGLPT